MYRAVWCWLSRIERFPTSSHPNSAFVMNPPKPSRSEEHTSELQSQSNLVCRLLLEKKNKLHFLQDHRADLRNRIFLVAPADAHVVVGPLADHLARHPHGIFPRRPLPSSSTATVSC